MSDIHNEMVSTPYTACGCFRLQSYKIWVIYTTMGRWKKHTKRVVLDCKVIKFEWYTQPRRTPEHSARSCFRLQSYKIWVIYTTKGKLLVRTVMVVLDCKVIKFEWYTQRMFPVESIVGGCFRLQSYKIWVIYTTEMHIRPPRH